MDVTDSPTDWVAKHIKRYVESDGEKGHDFYGAPALLLTTRGRKSGKLRRTALYYGRHGGSYIVIASNGGAPEHPLWYRNLAADPQVWIQVGPDVMEARARDATPEERPALWDLMVGVFKSYADYQKKAEREIPVVVIEPVDPPSS